MKEIASLENFNSTTEESSMETKIHKNIQTCNVFTVFISNEVPNAIEYYKCSCNSRTKSTIFNSN